MVEAPVGCAVRTMVGAGAKFNGAHGAPYKLLIIGPILRDDFQSIVVEFREDEFYEKKK